MPNSIDPSLGPAAAHVRAAIAGPAPGMRDVAVVTPARTRSVAVDAPARMPAGASLAGDANVLQRARQEVSDGGQGDGSCLDGTEGCYHRGEGVSKLHDVETRDGG